MNISYKIVLLVCLNMINTTYCMQVSSEKYSQEKLKLSCCTILQVGPAATRKEVDEAYLFFNASLINKSEMLNAYNTLVAIFKTEDAEQNQKDYERTKNVCLKTYR